MKRWFIIFGCVFLSAMISEAASVTQGQAQQVQLLASDILESDRALLQYASSVNSLFNANFILPIMGSTQTITIPLQTQTQVIDVQHYLQLKANLVNLVNQLP